MNLLAALATALLAGLCSATPPGAPDIATALALASPGAPAPPVRIVRCVPVKERPDQFGCEYETQAPTGQWARWGGTFAQGEGGWRMVDGPLIVTVPTDPSGLVGVTVIQ